jgi:hypothetical protein
MSRWTTKKWKCSGDMTSRGGGCEGKGEYTSLSTCCRTRLLYSERNSNASAIPTSILLVVRLISYHFSFSLLLQGGLCSALVRGWICLIAIYAWLDSDSVSDPYLCAFISLLEFASHSAWEHRRPIARGRCDRILWGKRQCMLHYLSSTSLGLLRARKGIRSDLIFQMPFSYYHRRNYQLRTSIDIIIEATYVLLFGPSLKYDAITVERYSFCFYWASVYYNLSNYK